MAGARRPAYLAQSWRSGAKLSSLLKKCTAFVLTSLSPGIHQPPWLPACSCGHTQICVLKYLRVQITITTKDVEVNAEEGILPINYPRFASMVAKGDTIFLGRYLVTGSEDSSLYLTVRCQACSKLIFLLTADNCANQKKVGMVSVICYVVAYLDCVNVCRVKQPCA